MVRTSRPLICLALLLSPWCRPSAFAQDNEEPVFGGAEFVAKGVRGRVYALPEGTSALPADYSDLELLGTIYAETIDVSSRSWTDGFPGVTDRIEWFAIVYDTSLKVTEGGHYTFRVYSDDGARLYIDETLVVDNDGLHAARSRSGGLELARGRHSMRLEYFQGPRTEVALQLFRTREGVAEELFPGLGIELRTPKPLGRRVALWLLLLLVLLLLLGPRLIQDADRDEDDFDPCEDLYDEEMVRGDYPRWIKDLLCSYLRADFSVDAQRRAFVDRALAALRAHAAGNDTWSVDPARRIIHIVTEHPAHIVGNSVQEYDLAGLERSRRNPEMAAIGIQERFFMTPAPTTGAEADQAVEEAETTLLVIYGLKIMADLMAARQEGLPENRAARVVEGKMERFKRQFLRWAPRTPTVSFPILPKPADPPPAQEPLDRDAAINLEIHELAEGVRVAIDDVPANQRLGDTTCGWGISRRARRWRVRGWHKDRLESIESRDVFTVSRGAVLRLRTYFTSHVFPGVRVRRMVNRQHRAAVAEVLDVNGASMAAAIREHELRHSSDDWEAWQATLQALVVDPLNAPPFDGFVHKVVRAFPVRVDDHVYLDIAAAYLYAAENADNAREAEDWLAGRFSRTGLQELHEQVRQRLERERQTRAEGFHRAWEGMTDDGKRVSGEGRPVDGPPPAADDHSGEVPAPPREEF